LIVEKPLVHGGAAKHCASTKHNGMPDTSVCQTHRLQRNSPSTVESQSIAPLQNTPVCQNIDCRKTARPQWSRKASRLYKTHRYARTLIVEKTLVHGGAARYCGSTTRALLILHIARP
jgi:hypothetical protein